MKFTSRLLREPLVQFLLIGGLLFTLYALVSAPAPAPKESIVVTPARIAILVEGFQRVWGRPPDAEERANLIGGFVREEVHYREAVALGLDRDDPVVRNRLRQKLEFLTDSSADQLQPQAGELEAYLAANGAAYERPRQLALEQIYLGAEPKRASVEVALAGLQNAPGTDPATFGEHTLLPQRLGLSTEGAVDGTFGEGFFARVEALPTGIWSGPVPSAFGMHLVRIDQRLADRQPTLDQIDREVLRDWRTMRQRELREALYERMRERYEIRIEDDVATPSKPGS